MSRGPNGRFQKKVDTTNQKSLFPSFKPPVKLRGLEAGYYTIEVDLTGRVVDIVSRKELERKEKREENRLAIDEAKEIIYGDREKTYGRPDKNLRVIAELWSAYLNGKYRDTFLEVGLVDPIQLKHVDTSMMQILLKIAREINMHKRDNPLDMIGYAALIDRIEEEFSQKGE